MGMWDDECLRDRLAAARHSCCQLQSSTDWRTLLPPSRTQPPKPAAASMTDAGMRCISLTARAPAAPPALCALSSAHTKQVNTKTAHLVEVCSSAGLRQAVVKLVHRVELAPLCRVRQVVVRLLDLHSAGKWCPVRPCPHGFQRLHTFANLTAMLSCPYR